ncbi:MAG: T9SS type A sorting domain-containing protein [Duncaniella sp.]|nr:T9SS type A sorting domain-containing protein [Duncaniella sp.]
MKQLYALLLIALLGGTVSARELTFYMGDQKITPGSTVYFSDIKVQELGGGMKMLTYDPSLFLTTDIYSSKIQVVAECTSGQTIQMCCGALCESGTTVTKNNVKIQTGDMLPLQFEYMNSTFTGEEYPVVTATIKAMDTAYPETLVTFNIVMGPNVSSLSKVEAAKSVRYTQAGLEYNVNGQAAISLYSITGTQVLAAKVNGSGTVDTHSLRPGVYIYTVTATDGNRSTGKIHVR